MRVFPAVLNGVRTKNRITLEPKSRISEGGGREGGSGAGGGGGGWGVCVVGIASGEERLFFLSDDGSSILTLGTPFRM